ncbi:DNA repair protein XRCC4 isoform X2 [Melanotaenia boesemani]|nr:DNA repair protein XRCC4 isoform X2 [Melanotaenia boesemani]XP_041825998.1 DNA repair protein XRCC4 isoform X2 [Melanotaenia boesemani]
MHTSLREIHISESDSSYFLRVDWEGRSLSSGFQLLLTDGQDAWRGEVSEAAVSAEAEELEMQQDKYVQDLQQALTGAEKAASYSFTLSPHPPTNSRTLTYEKMQKDILFRLGSVMLESVAEPTEVVRKLLVHSLQQGHNLQQNNLKLEEQNQQFIQEQQRITAEMNRYAGGKEVLEAELFSRFVLVLNEKKAKIRSLQETITRLQEARSADGQKSPKSLKSAQTGGQDSEAEDGEYGGSTDEEAEEVRSTPASNLPSRECSTPSPLDDSLRDITDVAPCRKRRLRLLRPPDAAVKRPNPETSQKRRSDSNPGSSKKPTPQSSADVAVEDLFEDF